MFSIQMVRTIQLATMVKGSVTKCHSVTELREYICIHSSVFH